MRQSLRYASWLLLLFILLSCSHRVTGEATALPPILQAEAQSQKYNLQLDFMKHHFSGMLIVRQMPDNEIRILGSTYFGLSLFDFSLHCDTFIVNSCMEPMRKKKMLKILETDFKNLFLKNEKAHIKKKSSTFEQKNLAFFYTLHCYFIGTDFRMQFPVKFKNISTICLKLAQYLL